MIELVNTSEMTNRDILLTIYGALKISYKADDGEGWKFLIDMMENHLFPMPLFKNDIGADLKFKGTSGAAP